MTKPFSVQEVIAQVQAIFRRADNTSSKPGANSSDSICVQGIVVIPSAHRVKINGNRTANVNALFICQVAVGIYVFVVGRESSG